MNPWRFSASGLWLLALSACGGEARSASVARADTVQGRTAVADAGFTVDTATVRLPLELPAQLYVEHDAVIVARAAGTVDSIFVELGDHVKAGQKLARLESAAQELALADAEATFDNLERMAGRARALSKSGGITAADSEHVEFELRQAEIARRKARREVDLTHVRAPFAGIVSARAVRPGRFTAAGDTLFRVTESAPLFARVRVPATGASQVRPGESVEIMTSSGETSPGVILHAAPVLDAASGTREVILRVSRPRGTLLAGASVTVRMGRERRRVVTVPAAAIAPEGYALVVENGRSTMRAVVLGAALDGGRVEIVSGLSPGERLARPVR